MPSNFTRQSTSLKKLHAAIIMDGNGRWATMRGLPRIAGHRAGADAVHRTVEAAPDVGIGILTLYAFSSDNWRRPSAEVSAFMELLDLYLRKETQRCLENGVRLEVIGRRDRLDRRLVAAIERTEAATAAGETLALRVAVDYSAREAIRAGQDRAGRGSADSHRRGAAFERFSPLGVRLRGTDLLQTDVARFRPA